MNIIEYIKQYGTNSQKNRLQSLEITNTPILIGVSGTIAKTSVTELIGQFLMSIGKKTMMTGTSGIKINSKSALLDYPYTSAPTKQELCEMFLIGLENNVEYMVTETTAESTSVGVYSNLHFDILTITNIIKEVVRSFATQSEYILQKVQLYAKNEIDTIIYNSQCEKYIAEAINSNQTIKNKIYFNKHDVKYNVDRQGKLTIDYFGTTFSTNLLSSINLDNIIQFIVTISQLGLYNELYIKRFLLEVTIPGRLEHYNILDREVVIDSGYGGPESIIPYFNESDYRNTYIVLSTYCFGNDKDLQPIIKSFRQNKASYFGQVGTVILTTGGAKRNQDNEQLALQQMQEALDEVYQVEPNRVKAIELSWSLSQPGDRIYITGMGTELYDSPDGKGQYNDIGVIVDIVNKSQ